MDLSVTIGFVFLFFVFCLAGMWAKENYTEEVQGYSDEQLINLFTKMNEVLEIRGGVISAKWYDAVAAEIKNRGLTVK